MSSSEITFEQAHSYPEEKIHHTENNQFPMVGQEVKYFISELKHNGNSILKLLEDISFDNTTHDLLQNYIHEFSSQTFRIAVIGQMKAGKSSFINAFTRRVDLLPADVNPWTTVITKLHFTNNEFSHESSEFNFFPEEGWARLAEGRGTLRELIDRFIPGFENEAFEEHINEMRERALQRHGENFHSLLGQTHSYDYVNLDLIKQYVCAGEFWNEASEKANIGVFSDITETANLYLRPMPFAYPTVLIDTPGTNDPFFIRDEITCQNLDNADIFIVVLHAQQALTMSDLGLLRILQGLNKDRVVIFINRIDQLNDIENDIVAIKRHVEMILASEFPSVEFPIICGSAKWGLDGIRSESQDLYNSSGINEIAHSISRMMLKGTGRNSVTKIISNLKLAAEAVKAVKVNQGKSNIPMDTHLSSGNKDEELWRVNDNITEVKNAAAKASHYSILFEKQLEDLTQSLLSDFRTKLNNIILEFTDKEIQNMLLAIEKGQGNKVWNCDTMSIRRALENDFLRICKEAANKINASQEIIAQALRNLILSVKPNFDTSFIQFNAVQEGEPYLSTLALNHKLALELDNSWWKHWWTKKRKKEEWSEELSELIKRDFFPMAERLVQSAKLELSESSKDSLNNFLAINGAVSNILDQEVQNLTAYAQKIMETGVSDEGHAVQDILNSDMGKIKEADHIIDNLQNLQRYLKTL